MVWPGQGGAPVRASRGIRARGWYYDWWSFRPGHWVPRWTAWVAASLTSDEYHIMRSRHTPLRRCNAQCPTVWWCDAMSCLDRSRPQRAQRTIVPSPETDLAAFSSASDRPPE